MTNEPRVSLNPKHREAVPILEPWQRPVVWAVDAFPDEDEMSLRTARCLEIFFPDSPIHPVYILSEESFVSRSFNGMLDSALKPMALNRLQEFLKQIPSLKIQKPRVLVENSASKAACAEKLMHYAQRIGAGMIAAGSHGRHGFSRLFIGSFSEAILDQSELPLLISGPRLKTPLQRPRAVVFPTDFSASAHRAYADILCLTKHLDAELHLFHKTISILDPMLQSGVSLLGGGWVSVEPYMLTTPEEHRLEAEAWLKRAELEGVRAIFRRENFREPTSDAIVEYVKTLGEASVLLAMISHTSHKEAMLIGSVTRDVIRRTPCPVYVVGHTRD